MRWWGRGRRKEKGMGMGVGAECGRLRASGLGVLLGWGRMGHYLGGFFGSKDTLALSDVAHIALHDHRKFSKKRKLWQITQLVSDFSLGFVPFIIS